MTTRTAAPNLTAGSHRVLTFHGVRVFLADEFVLSIFDDTTATVIDVRGGDTPRYRADAESCGYDAPGRDWRRYARHHDIVHHWLADQHGRSSGVLQAVAHGGHHPEAAGEEHHVNCLQRLWSDARSGTEWREKEITAAWAALGDEWCVHFVALTALLDSIP